MPPDPEARFAEALAHHEAGRTRRAAAHYREILASDPDHVESLHLLGLLAVEGGDATSGASLIQRAMTLAPGRAPHHNSLALAWRALGRDADAAAAFRAAAALRPDSPEIHNNLATTLLALGQRAAAIEEYRAACAHGPGIAAIWDNLANALAAEGRAAEAEPCFRQAVELAPQLKAHYGRFLIVAGRWGEAEALLREAVRLVPQDASAWNNLGVARQEQGRLVEAAACYRRAAELAPGFADAHYNLGCVLAAGGDADAAVRCHEAAIAADPAHGRALLGACMARLPILYRTDAEVALRRADYLAALERLAAAAEAPETGAAIAAAIGASQPFFLPYQGQNDRDAQAVYGGLACRLLAGSAPVPVRRANQRGRVRLGIVSGFFLDHTIFRLFLQGWLSELDRDRFEVAGFHTGRGEDAYTAWSAARCEHFVRGISSPAMWAEAVAAWAPDVLLYPEIGIDPVAGRLAPQRLAPVQCVTWGHPVTSGMPSMDYFLSAGLMEPEDADGHYTERLVRLPALGLHYTPEERAGPALDRAALGLPDGVPVYWSGQALYKYAPCHDRIFPLIVAAVGACRFVFIGFAKSAGVTAAFRDRLALAFREFGLDSERYCVFLPPLPQQRFIEAARLADVILDTPCWSGGRSTLDCLALDPAIVTLPSRFMRGRHTWAILRRIGCRDTIARSVDDYVAIAARLGKDAAWRAEVRRGVAERKHTAFRDTRYMRALEDFLAHAARQDVPMR